MWSEKIIVLKCIERFVKTPIERERAPEGAEAPPPDGRHLRPLTPMLLVAVSGPVTLADTLNDLDRFSSVTKRSKHTILCDRSVQLDAETSSKQCKVLLQFNRVAGSEAASAAIGRSGNFSRIVSELIRHNYERIPPTVPAWKKHYKVKRHSAEILPSTMGPGCLLCHLQKIKTFSLFDCVRSVSSRAYIRPSTYAGTPFVNVCPRTCVGEPWPLASVCDKLCRCLCLLQI